MALNLAAPTEIPGETGPHGTKVVTPPPALDEIARHFPQFEILECLGRGGMGVVYKARQPKLNRLVALKILAPEKVADTKFSERFQREAQALARLNHPNIVTVYDFGEADGLYFLTMEFVDGVSLRQLLQTRKIAPEEALAIVPKICEALQFAHEQGVVHRDIKPENVLLDKQGRLKIADFGIAKIVADAGESPFVVPPSGGPDRLKPELQTLTQNQVLGTPHYMAPEQVEKPATVDHRADIYSLGVVFYEMLTGELPLGRFQPPSRKVQVDVRLDEVVLHALEKEPERRYQHASEVKTAVENLSDVKTGAGGIAKGSGVGLQPIATDMSALKRRVPWQIWVVTALLALEGIGNLFAIPRQPQAAGWLLAKVLFITGLLLGWRSVFVLNLIVAGIHVVYFASASIPIALMNLVLMVLVGSAYRFYFDGDQGASRSAAEAEAMLPPEQATPNATSATATKSPRQNTSLLILGAGFVLPSVLFIWFLLAGHRLYGVDLDADVQFWLGVAGLPMSTALGLLLAWLGYLACRSAGWLSGLDSGPGRWCPQAWVAAALLAISLPFAGGAAVMAQLISKDTSGWHPGSGEFWIVMLVAAGTLMTLFSSTLLGIAAVSKIRRAQPLLRGRWPAMAAAVYWPAVLVLAGSLLALPSGADSEPNLLVTGLVVDAETGKPIAGARVDDSRYGPNRVPQQSWTGASGYYELRTWYEEHTISASAPGYEPKHETLLTKPFGGWERSVVIDFKLRAIAKPAPTFKSGVDQSTAQEIARLKLRNAEQELKVAENKFSVGVMTKSELQKITWLRDIAAAAVKGDTLEIARLKLATAESDLQVVEQKHSVGMATSQEFEQAKLARDIEMVRFKQAQAIGGTATNSAPDSTGRNELKFSAKGDRIEMESSDGHKLTADSVQLNSNGTLVAKGNISAKGAYPEMPVTTNGFTVLTNGQGNARDVSNRPKPLP